MRRISTCVMSDSLGLTYDASEYRFGFYWRFVEWLRRRSPDVAVLPYALMSNYSGLVGNCWRLWEDYFRLKQPDIVLMQIGENEIPASPPTQVATAASWDAQDIVFDQAPAVNQLYRLGDDATYEWVFVGSSSGNTAKQVRRGLFGTRPRTWVAGTPIAHDADFSGTAWSDRYSKMLDTILGSTPSGNRPLLLCGGKWFEGATGTASEKIRSLIAVKQGQGFDNVEFCPLAKADGTSIFSDLTLQGPSATTQSVTLDGTAGNKAIVLDTNVFAAPARNFRVGEPILVSLTQAPAAAGTNWECMAVVSIDSDTQITVSRSNLTGTQRDLSAAGTKYIGKLAAGVMNAGAPYLQIGSSSYFAYGRWALDTHPNDGGHDEISQAYQRGLERLSQRLAI